MSRVFRQRISRTAWPASHYKTPRLSSYFPCRGARLRVYLFKFYSPARRLLPSRAPSVPQDSIMRISQDGETRAVKARGVCLLGRVAATGPNEIIRCNQLYGCRGRPTACARKIRREGKSSLLAFVSEGIARFICPRVVYRRASVSSREQDIRPRAHSIPAHFTAVCARARVCVRYAARSRLKIARCNTMKLRKITPKISQEARQDKQVGEPCRAAGKKKNDIFLFERCGVEKSSGALFVSSAKELGPSASFSFCRFHRSIH